MSSVIKKIGECLTNPKTRFMYMSRLGIYNKWSDEKYLKKLYFLNFGKKLDLDNPMTFNEKLQWLKIHDRKPEYTTMVDKYAVKEYVANKIGKEYIIPTLGVWDRFDDIDFDKLPDQFVLKCTHDSGGLAICKDKKNFDIKAAKEKIEKSMKRNYYWLGREWPYKNVPPRIIAEKYMSQTDSEELNDYKLMCFNSKVKATFVCSNRFSPDGLKVTFYDTDWNRMPFERHYKSASCNICKPKSYEQMVAIAEKLAQGIPFVRVDFYEIEDRPYFGELTFFPGSGLEEFRPAEWDKKLGELIYLSGGGYLIVNPGYLLLIHEEKSESLRDYKFYCFNGEPKYLYVSDNLENHARAKISFADCEWNKAPFGRTDYKGFDELPEKPELFEKMKLVTKELSKDIPFLRVDLYEINKKIYFGELTFYPCSGFMPFKPENWDNKLGQLIVLPQNFPGGGDM